MTSKQRLSLALLCIASAISTSTLAASQAQQQAIERLGRLNGTALHCSYFDETQRLKEAMVATVPKVRALGALFEEATNQSFMREVANKSVCPNRGEFAGQVSAGIKNLKNAFPQQ